MSKLRILLHRGAASDAEISADHQIGFKGDFSTGWSTVAAPSAVVPAGKKGWYELTLVGGSGWSQVGWATSGFLSSATCTRSERVGMCANSWGFGGQWQKKLHAGTYTEWGTEIEENSTHVIGVAADLETGRLLFSLDGSWGEPMGVAFHGGVVDTRVPLFPVISGWLGRKVFVNLGQCRMQYGPPNHTFLPLKDVVTK